MDKKHRKLLLKKRLLFVENLEPNDISGYMFQERLISENDKEEIENQVTRRQRVEWLLDLLPRKGPLAFQKFCNILKESKTYSFLADQLSEKAKKKENPDCIDGEELSRNSPNIPIRPRYMSQSNMLNNYSISSDSRGWCYILNNYEFWTLPDRPGSTVDANNLQKLFSRLGFKTLVQNNADTRTIRDSITSLSNQTDHTDCLVVCILSHGLAGQIYGIDGELVPISEIMEILSQGKVASLLDGKPKLFFIQACRVIKEKKDLGKTKVKEIPSSKVVINHNKAEETDGSEKNAYDALINETAQQFHSDLLLGYSTFPGEVSWRHAKLGSYFIDSLVEVFNEYVASEDVSSMLIKVNERVKNKLLSHGFTQIPAPVMTLTKKLYFVRNI